MAGVKRTLDAIHESEAEDSESDESTSTHEQSLVINTRTDALIVLKKALAKAPSAELEAFKEFFVSCEFMNAFDDYSAVWEYTHFLSWLVDKKLSDANKNINKARLHKTPVKVGDKFTFSVDSHVVAVCVPCFEAGRTPQRCLFTGLSGFVNHRKVSVSDLCATVNDQCKNPVTVQIVNQINGNGGPNKDVQIFHKTVGYDDSHYRLFKLPYIHDGYTSVEYVAVDKGTKVAGVKWEVVGGCMSIEHEMHSTTFQSFVREVIAGMHTEFCVTDHEKKQQVLLSQVATE